MEHDADFKINVRTEWKTKFPEASTTLTSPTFSLMVSEWYLDFYCEKRRSSPPGFVGPYIVHLNPTLTKGDKEEALKSPVEVETCMRHPTDDSAEPTEKQSCKITLRKRVQIYVKSLKPYLTKGMEWFNRRGEMRLVCLFYTSKNGSNRELENIVPDGPSDLECLSLDLGRLLQGEQLPDVRLNCGGQTFPAHRSILTARSEVFAAMFRNKMAESETGVVDVKDFGHDVIRHFLQYVYSGKLTAQSADAIASLYVIADKYAVESLKRACTRWIVRNLTEGNCLQYLTVADLHDSESLKKVAIAFICGHPDVMLGEEWPEFSEKHPKLAVEVVQSFVRAKTKS